MPRCASVGFFSVVTALVTIVTIVLNGNSFWTQLDQSADVENQIMNHPQTRQFSSNPALEQHRPFVPQVPNHALQGCGRKDWYNDEHLVDGDEHLDMPLWEPQREALNMLPVRKRNYWLCRRDGALYWFLRALVREYGASAKSLLDVGSYLTPFVAEFDWIPVKVVTDLQIGDYSDYFAALGLTAVAGNFTTLDFGRRFDILTCFQVVEHLPDVLVKKFVQHMLEVADVVIVSTTFELAAGKIDGHIQDPISYDKFRSWFGAEAHLRVEIVQAKYSKNIIGIVGRR